MMWKMWAFKSICGNIRRSQQKVKDFGFIYIIDIRKEKFKSNNLISSSLNE